MNQSSRTDVDDFLAWVEVQRERYELVGGRLVLMAGGSEAHSDLQVNLLSTLKRRLRGGPCKPTAAICWCASMTGPAASLMRA